MGHCSIHGTYRDRVLSDGCPDCQQAEERAENDRKEAAQAAEARAERAEEAAKELAERAEEAADERLLAQAELQVAIARDQAYRVNNPGDYECPACLYKTLKRGATRCKCGAVVLAEYWESVRSRERLQQEREERERAERYRKQQEHEAWLASPEGTAATKAAAVAAAAIVARQKRSDTARTLAIIGLVCSIWPFGFCSIGVGVQLGSLISEKRGFDFGSLLFCLVVTSVGPVLGVLALQKYRGGSHRKGMWLAVAAILIPCLMGFISTAINAGWI